jgi:hypothetical protein
MLDFIFVTGPVDGLELTCEVLVLEDDFPDDEKTSDHRALLTIVQ